MTAALRTLRYDEVDSTQRIARELIESGSAGDFTCVVAARQTAGRGRLGRTWLAPEGGLFMSLILFPRCRLKEAPHITMGTADGLLAALDALGVHAFVKWPNDVVIARPARATEDGRIGPFRKVAGVLVEVARSKGDVLEACIVGVGVNVASPADGWPEEIARTAGALADDGFTGTADDVLAAIERALPDALSSALSSSFADGTLARLRSRSATLGRRVEVEGLVGEARAIDDDGALVVVDGAGVAHTVRAGDVWLA